MSLADRDEKEEVEEVEEGELVEETKAKRKKLDSSTDALTPFDYSTANFTDYTRGIYLYIKFPSSI